MTVKASLISWRMSPSEWTGGVGRGAHWAEVLVCLAVRLGVGALAFGHGADSEPWFPLELLIFPILLWSAVRYGQKGVTGGVLIIAYDLYVVDPILTFAIACYILYHSYAMLRRTIDILMEGTPPGLDLDEVVQSVEAISPVCDMHHVHVWQIDERTTALEAHITIEPSDLEQMEAVKSQIKHLLADRFEIEHSTLEFELGGCNGGHTADCFRRHHSHMAHASS